MIATVYKPSRLKDGKRIVARMYRGKYRLDPREKVKDVALHTNDKQVAEQKIRIILQEQRGRDGILAPKIQRDVSLMRFAAKREASQIDSQKLVPVSHGVRECPVACRRTEIANRWRGGL